MYVLLAEGRLFHYGFDERPVDALLCQTLADLPQLGRDLFDGGENTIIWEHTGPADINGGPDRVTLTHLVEVKNTTAEYNKDQLDRYLRDYPNAHASVVLPHDRAAATGESLSSPDCRGRVEMREWGNTTGDQWRIVTWEAVRDWLRDHLGHDHPRYPAKDPLFPLVAAMARVY